MAEFLNDDKAYRLYRDESIQSDGFYVSNDYGAHVPCGIVRIKKQDELKYKKAKRAAEYALEKYNNNENKKLVLLEITNLNMQATAGALYYITFKAKDSSSDQVQTYQTKVLEKLNTGLHVQIFKVAPNFF